MNITIQILDLMTRGITNGIRGIFDIKIAKNSFKSIFDLLNLETKIDHTSEGNINKTSPNNIKGKIEFKNVFFRYPINLNKNQEQYINDYKGKYILKNVNFTVEAGKKVALIGHSGCGKSTILKLLERFYDPEKGEILFDGINIKNYNLFDLRKKIGLVNQEPSLFKRSIYENIKYGKLDSNKNDIILSAKNALIDGLLYDNKNNFVFDDLYYYKSKTSGGEKQRISMARTFLKKPNILLLDEHTSSLDKKNEIEINKNIDKLMNGKTCFIATHRIDSIINADVILLFKNGELIEKGTHKELMNIEGEYKKFFH